jgi:hypothetical protein
MTWCCNFLLYNLYVLAEHVNVNYAIIFGSLQGLGTGHNTMTCGLAVFSYSPCKTLRVGARTLGMAGGLLVQRIKKYVASSTDDGLNDICESLWGHELFWVTT